MVARTLTDADLAIRHFHVSESDLGCLPEAEPYVTDDAEHALDALAHLLLDWSETVDRDDPDSTVAAAISEAYCACCDSQTSAECSDAHAHLTVGQDVCEIVGLREFRADACSERDCLKYCPAGDCRTVTSVTDPDTWCWVCGAKYVASDLWPWLA